MFDSIPSKISVICKSDGKPAKGILLLLTVEKSIKNHHTVLFGPSDRHGKASIARRTIVIKCNKDVCDYPMDYSGEPTGGFSIEPIGPSLLAVGAEIALKMGDSSRYNKLVESLSSIRRLNPDRIDIEPSDVDNQPDLQLISLVFEKSPSKVKHEVLSQD